jgi:hypothetical protein
MPDTETRPLFPQSFVAPGGERQTYHAPGLTPSEMAMYALQYMNRAPRDYSTFELYTAAMDEANRFATFCIGETIDESGDWCDPGQSFNRLWDRFITT